MTLPSVRTAVLESAPAFEKAQALLLELRGRTPEERER
jgi:hypothetical protein